jgi:hypothetical protein
MNREFPRAVLVAPVFLYLAAIGIAAVHPINGLVVLAIASSILPLIPWIIGRSSPLTFVASPLILGLVGMWSFLAGSSPTGPTASLDAGVILASPLWFLAAILDSRREPGVSVFATVSGLAVGAMILATLNRMIGEPTSGPTSFLGALGSVLHDQASALVQLLGGTVPTNIPLSQVSDPIYAVLGVAAGIGIVAPWLEAPAIDELSERRAAGFGADPHGETAGVPLHLPPEMDRRLDEGSTPVIASRPSFGDAGPLLAAALAALGFVAFAAEAPAYSLLGVGVGAALAGVAVAWAIRGPPRRRRRLPSPSSTSVAPSELSRAGVARRPVSSNARSMYGEREGRS